MLEHAIRSEELGRAGGVADIIPQGELGAVAGGVRRRLRSVPRSLDVGRGERQEGSAGAPSRGGERDFLARGGEMGERIRAYDWSATPLGAPGRWPRGLRNALRLLLTASHP